MKAVTRDLLIEIGVEEMPAHACAATLAQFQARMVAALDAARLTHGEVRPLGTPRRLALWVRDLALRQPDRELLNKGPAKRAAYDAEGRLTRAAEGFARGQGIPVEALEIIADDKGGEYLYARKQEIGQTAQQIVPAVLTEVIGSLEFAKSMRWGSGSRRFIRPIRWLVALLGTETLDFTFDGVQASNVTHGHRTLAPTATVAVTAAQDYIGICARNFVLVDPALRRERIWQQVQAVADELQGVIPPNEDLLAEITWLVEEPLAFAGQFDADYLTVPAAVLVTSMRENQRYFPVYARAEGPLLPNFVAVRNGGMDHLANVRHGNEKVLRGRLADARFFWDEDQRQRLDDRLVTLQTVVFQERLGSQFARTQRIMRLADRVAAMLEYSQPLQQQTIRGAELSKCDLVTHMVNEFPELQGVMGGEYARVQGEPAAVAAGIGEHYRPASANDALPQTPVGIAVGLADRLDMLAGYFLLGLVPSGSADPFALRRAAQGVTRIITGTPLTLRLGELIDAALTGYEGIGDAAAAYKVLLAFFQARMENLLHDRGMRGDVAAAVLAAGFDDLTDAVTRAEVLNAIVSAAEFAPVAAAFKRIANIALKASAELAAANVSDVDFTLPASGVDPAEQRLWTAFTNLRREAEANLRDRDYARFYRAITQLKEPVDTFFDQVMVMDEDLVVRRRRLQMLRTISTLLTVPADLSVLTLA